MLPLEADANAAAHDYQRPQFPLGGVVGDHVPKTALLIGAADPGKGNSTRRKLLLADRGSKGQEQCVRQPVDMGICAGLGGIIIEGAHGTGKTVLARALQQLLPAIEVCDGLPS
jgi:Magnesium chelatase, subunit ChlI